VFRRPVARTFALFGSLLIPIGAATLAATVTIPIEFRNVVSLSTIIARGHVTDVRGIVLHDGKIETVATVAVDNALKGQPEAFVSVRLPGGEVGRTKMVMIGAPTVKVGEHAVFFLKPGPDNVLRPVGLMAGVYPIQPDSRSGRAVIAPPVVAGQTSMGRGAVTRGDTRRKPMSILEFESLVKLVMSAPAAKAVPRAVGRGRGGL
jgi:hypothetical protein